MRFWKLISQNKKANNNTEDRCVKKIKKGWRPQQEGLISVEIIVSDHLGTEVFEAIVNSEGISVAVKWQSWSRLSAVSGL